MSIFREDDQAEIDMERIKLKALEDTLKTMKPLYTRIELEISMIKEAIGKLEQELEDAPPF